MVKTVLNKYRMLLILSAVFCFYAFQCAENMSFWDSNELMMYKHEIKKANQEISITNMSGETVHVDVIMFHPDYYYLQLNSNVVFNGLAPLSFRASIKDSETVNDKIPLCYTDNPKCLYKLIGYKVETLKQYARETIIKQDIYDYNVSYSYEDLKSMNFQIILPK